LRKIVVFSDIDGTLIDIFTRNYGKSKELVNKLNESSIPVILCSSKTWAEQDVIRKDLGLESEPFIIENGGAVIIPDGYFGSHGGGRGGTVDDLKHHYGMRVVDGYSVIELGRSSAEIRKVLQEVRSKTGIPFKGVSDLSIEELAKIVGMTHEEAERMSKRQYGETILEIDKTEKVQFEQALSEEGFQVIHGGRYFDVTAGNDKGKAVRILIDLYRKKLGDDTIFIGIGDSANDLPMLKLTDIAILVQKHDGTWAEVDSNDNNIPHVVKAEGIGPAGWENAFATIIKEAEQTDGA
jgi:mannosyl-3-phosphoglycerate phosphatase